MVLEAGAVNLVIAIAKAVRWGDRRILGEALRGGALGGRHDHRGLPVRRARAGHPGAGPAAPVRLVAWILARTKASLLIGQSASHALSDQLRGEIEALEHVQAVPPLIASVIGPGQLIVAAQVDSADDDPAGEIERIADEAERRLVARYAGVRYVVLDPPQVHGSGWFARGSLRGSGTSGSRTLNHGPDAHRWRSAIR